MEVVVITPQKKLFEGKALSVSVRGIEGEMEILPEHAPLLSQLAEGEMKIKTAHETKVFKVSSGFIEAHDSKVTLLVKDVG